MNEVRHVQELEAIDDEAPEQHDDNANEAHIGNSSLVMLAPNNYKAGLCGAGSSTSPPTAMRSRLDFFSKVVLMAFYYVKSNTKINEKNSMSVDFR